MGVVIDETRLRSMRSRATSVTLTSSDAAAEQSVINNALQGAAC